MRALHIICFPHIREKETETNDKLFPLTEAWAFLFYCREPPLHGGHGKQKDTPCESTRHGHEEQEFIFNFGAEYQ